MRKIGAKALKVLEYLVEQSRPVTLAEAKEATGLPGQIGAGAMTHLCNKHSNLVYKIPGNPPRYMASPAAAKHLEIAKGKTTKDGDGKESEVVTPLIVGADLHNAPAPILSAAELISLNATAYITQAGGQTAIHVEADKKATAQAI